MKEYNLSDYVRKIIQHFENGNRGISVSNNHDPYNDEIKKIIETNEVFFKKEVEGHKGAVYTITKEYELNIEYLYNFLLMCEALLTDEKPTINRFNENKFWELKNKNIIDFTENKAEIKDIKLLDLNLLEDEYFNMRYVLDGPIIVNVMDGNKNCNFENANIQINSHITENAINDFVQAILILIAMENDVPEYIKADLADNREDKNKLQETLTIFSRWLISNSETAQINESVPILTNIALQALNQLNI